MNRFIKSISAIVLTTLFLFTAGCKNGEATLSGQSFVNVRWTRDTEYCTETICFNDDGSCCYYCACGEPLNEDDLCEGYTYDPDTKTITLRLVPTSDETVTKIVIKSCDENALVLDFDGEERRFERAKMSGMEFDSENYTLLDFPVDKFYYDLSSPADSGVTSVPHDKWDIISNEGDLFILNSQAEEAAAYYGDDENYTWSVFIDIPESEDGKTFPIALGDDISRIYDMEVADAKTTLFFDDIEIFASLIKTSKDGLISASISLAFFENTWYWRSDVFDDGVEGWPEYVAELPESLSEQLNNFLKP